MDEARISRALGKVFLGLGAAFVLSAALALPPVLALWHSLTPPELADVTPGFITAALLCGAALLGIGFLAIRGRLVVAKLGLVLTIVACVVMADRFLLLYHGLPLWAADAEAHFRNRPSKYSIWPNGREIQTNRYGYHDDEFPEKRADNELRVVVLGDSVTFGHMVTREEAFPNQLEQILAKRLRRPVQVINAGVQGYSTRQERIALERALRFQPDVVLVGVCLNDFTEPFTVDEELGGTGLDYHLVRQTGNAFFSYLLHETGVGRAALQAQWTDTTPELEKLREAQGVEAFARRSRDDSEAAPNYDYVLKNLERIYDLSRENDLRVAALLFPYTFQFREDPPLNPQRALAEHAEKLDVETVDFHTILAPRLEPGQANRYFQDNSHFTPFGHRVVAQTIADALWR